MMSDIRILLRNIELMARTVFQHAQDDPAHLLVQGTRRLPRRITRGVELALRKAPVLGLRALGAYCGGDTQRARELSEIVLADSGRGLPHRLAAEVALEVGSVAVSPTSVPPATWARLLWKQGHMNESLKTIDAAGRSHRNMARRLHSEAASMDTSFLLEPPRESPATRYRAAGDGTPRAFHILTGSVPHTRSGYTMRTQRLLKALTESSVSVQAVTRLGYPATVGIPFGSDKQEIDGVAYQRILPACLAPDIAGRLQQQVEIMAHTATEFCATVLHCTTNYTNALMADALARGLGLPWVYEVRGILEETWAAGRGDAQAQEEARNSDRFLALRDQETRMMLRANHVITLSEVMKGQLVNRGITPQKITVVPNGVSEEYFRARVPASDARRVQGLPAEGFWVGSVSSLVDYEGFDTLLRAAAAARREGEDVRVLLAGEGAARPALQRLAIELNMSSSVKFTGQVDAETAQDLHECLDLFCVPRTDAEVCRAVTPLKPIEALAARTPTLMSDLPPLRELAEGAYGGSTDRALVPADSVSPWTAAIVGASRTPWPETLLDAGREFARTRTWAGNAATIQDIYHEVMRP